MQQYVSRAGFKCQLDIGKFGSGSQKNMEKAPDKMFLKFQFVSEKKMGFNLSNVCHIASHSFLAVYTSEI